MDEFLDTNKEASISLDLKNKITTSLQKNSIFIYEISAKDLNLEKNICEFASKYYLKHKEIFQNEYSIGAIAATKNGEFYRIVLLLA